MKNQRKIRDFAGRANYGCLLRRFHEDEERKNMKNLLFGDIRLSRAQNVEDV